MLPLLKLLQDGRFHSGSALGLALGVSRAAVWKRLQSMEAEFGLVVHRVRGRGYRLERPLSLLRGGALSDLCAELGWSLHVHERLDSTNAEALRLQAAADGRPTLVLAESQSAGRGRRGREWVSPFAENLYYSLALRLDGGARQLEGLSLTVGLAVMHALRDAGMARVGLKWPNDLLLDGKKLAGILVELSGDPAGICHVVIGVGVNVNMRSASRLDQPWTSLALETGELCDRTRLAELLSRRLEKYLALQKAQGFAPLREEWERNHLWRGRRAALIAGAQVIEGEVLGVDAQGGLRLMTESGERSFSGGELSLRVRDDS